MTDVKKNIRIAPLGWPKAWADSLVRWQLKPVGERTQVRLTHCQFPNDDERDGHDEG